jgi:hypothetical protein
MTRNLVGLKRLCQADRREQAGNYLAGQTDKIFAKRKCDGTSLQENHNEKS